MQSYEVWGGADSSNNKHQLWKVICFQRKKVLKILIYMYVTVCEWTSRGRPEEGAESHIWTDQVLWKGSHHS